MKDEKDLETSDSYIDELGVVHISDWNKYWETFKKLKVFSFYIYQKK
jgi:hypothetical protein